MVEGSVSTAPKGFVKKRLDIEARILPQILERSALSYTVWKDAQSMFFRTWSVLGAAFRDLRRSCLTTGSIPFFFFFTFF